MAEPNLKSSLPSQKTKLISSVGARPSSTWTSFENLDDNRTRQVKYVFSSANWNFLHSKAVECHRQQSTNRDKYGPYGIRCEFRHDRFASGRSNLVLEVSFSDSTFWVVRIRFPDDDPDVETSILSEVATMRLIQERTSIPVSTVFGYDAAKNNPFGYPYIFLSVLPGHHLHSPLSSSVPPEYQEKVAEQLADILHQLSTEMRFEKIGRIWRGKSGKEEPSIVSFNGIAAIEDHYGKHPVGPFSTSLEYFYTLRQNENAAVCAALFQGDLGEVDDDLWLAACHLLGQSLCSLVSMETMNGPFPLQHVDLQHNNILFDDNYNITGIIDWSAAQTVPCESLAVCVEFIIPPGLSEDFAAQRSSFCRMVRKEWEERETDEADTESPYLISCIVGSRKAQLIHFSYTHSALRRSVAHARIIGGLLYGEGFALENVQAVFEQAVTQ